MKYYLVPVRKAKKSKRTTKKSSKRKSNGKRLATISKKAKKIYKSGMAATWKSAMRKAARG